jgi:hypothetical protein
MMVQRIYGGYTNTLKAMKEAKVAGSIPVAIDAGGLAKWNRVALRSFLSIFLNAIHS